MLKIKEDKMDINVAFYIDKSGSMDNSIDNVFEAVFYIADALKKYFGKEKVVNDTIFESYAFDVNNCSYCIAYCRIWVQSYEFYSFSNEKIGLFSYYRKKNDNFAS